MRLIQLSIGLLFLCVLPGVTECQPEQDTEEIRIWNEFIDELRSGKLEDPARYRPYFDSLLEPNMKVLLSIRDLAVPESLDAMPEIHHVENKIHYLLPILWKSTPEMEPSTFCFSLILEEDQWYFQHVENIFIRLDQAGPLPSSQFPDLPEERKAYMRDEFQVSKDVRLFNLLMEEKGRTFAIDWFKDGDGFALAAKVWVPFVPAERAFILYLCWDLANLRGEDCTLEKMEDREAVIRWRNTRYFALYMQTGHLRQQISIEDYAAIFETVWQDRARAAGWNLEMKQEGEAIVMHFTR